MMVQKKKMIKSKIRLTKMMKIKMKRKMLRMYIWVVSLRRDPFQGRFWELPLLSAGARRLRTHDETFCNLFHRACRQRHSGAEKYPTVRLSLRSTGH